MAEADHQRTTWKRKIMIVKTWQSRVAGLPCIGGVSPTALEIQLSMEAEIDELRKELVNIKQQKPIAYLAWRDGKPCWDGDECVCEDAVYPVDSDDDRESMPMFLAAGAQAAQQAYPLDTNDQVEELAKHCGWDNRKWMTPADYQIWCDRMRMFSALAAAPKESNTGQNDRLDVKSACQTIAP